MSQLSSSISCVVLAVVVTVGWFALPARAVVTTFDNGPEGWSMNGRKTISSTGGNPGANLGAFLPGSFGVHTINTTNTAFLGDLTRYGSPIRISIDYNAILVRSLPLGMPFMHNIVVKFIDTNDSDDPRSWVGVWYKLGTIGERVPGWQELSVTVDPTQTTLPDGWGGTGDEDPVTYMPRLPSDRTFASVMTSVDQIRFTTMVPGFVYLASTSHLQVDNIEVSAVPEPGGLGLLAVGGLFALRRRY